MRWSDGNLFQQHDLQSDRLLRSDFPVPEDSPLGAYLLNRWSVQVIMLLVLEIIKFPRIMVMVINIIDPVGGRALTIPSAD